MKAVIVKEAGGPENLAIEQVMDPLLGPEDILIQTHGIGLNNADLLQRRGLYPPPPGESPLMGLEVSGEVIETGANAKCWKKGDRVMALLASGGYAEKVKVHESLAMPMPDGLDYVAAAGIPEFWIVDLQNQLIEAHTSPANGIYHNIKRATRGETLTPQYDAKAIVSVNDILGKARS